MELIAGSGVVSVLILLAEAVALLAEAAGAATESTADRGLANPPAGSLETRPAD